MRLSALSPYLCGWLLIPCPRPTKRRHGPSPPSVGRRQGSTLIGSFVSDLHENKRSHVTQQFQDTEVLRGHFVETQENEFLIKDNAEVIRDTFNEQISSHDELKTDSQQLIPSDGKLYTYLNLFWTMEKKLRGDSTSLFYVNNNLAHLRIKSSGIIHI